VAAQGAFSNRTRRFLRTTNSSHSVRVPVGIWSDAQSLGEKDQLYSTPSIERAASAFMGSTAIHCLDQLSVEFVFRHDAPFAMLEDTKHRCFAFSAL